MKRLESMLELRIEVEEKAYIALLRLCEWRRASGEGYRVYELVSSLKSRLGIRLGNVLLSMFVRFGNLSDAWYVFDKMSERDVFSWNVFSWNVLVGGYAKAGCFDEALNLYHRMLWAEIRPDVYTFPSVLRTCGGVSDIARGKAIHAHVIRFGFESDVDVSNALISMYMKCGYFSNARKLFDKMPKRDRISWHAMISGYFENGEVLEGLRLFFMMRELSVDPDLMTITSVASACELLGDEKLGREIHGYVVRSEFGDGVPMNNSLIHMYTGLGHLEEAERVLTQMELKDVVSWTTKIASYDHHKLPYKAVVTYKMMELEGVLPDEITLVDVLSACACLGHLDLGIRLHEIGIKTGLISHVKVSNSLIDMYSKCKRVNKALEMKESTKPNSVTLITVLSACARIGALMRGKEIHAHALRTGVGFESFLPNAILDLYVTPSRDMESSLLSYWKRCLNQNKIQTRLPLFRYYVPAAGQHYACVVDLLGRAGRLDDAYDFIQDMPIKPDAAIWGALLNACRIHRNIELGELAATRVFENDDKSVVGYYILLCIG
ncbi:Pentatricopeptide repeat-containing protein, chloroplastic, partial [Cucurbita argyrosperma subsp. sororia]